MDYCKDPNIAISGNNQVKIIDGKKLSHALGVKDGSACWHKLSDLKKSHPLQVADFALAACISMNQLSNGGAKYYKQTHKFGIDFNKTVDEVYVINKANDTTFWHRAIELKMKNVWVAFDMLADGVSPPPDH
ncbi:hypothetical protein ACHAW6_006764 [Cyclotella cf. meneghiniana]